MNKSRGAAKRCLPELWCASAAQIAKARAAWARVCRNKARAAHVGAARARVRMRSGEVPQGKSPRGTRGRGKGKGVHAVRQDAAWEKPARHAWAR